MIDLIQYNSKTQRVLKNIQPDEVIRSIRQAPGNAVTWVDVEIDQVQMVHELAQFFRLHDLNLEDILTPNHLPKIDILHDYIFTTLKMLSVVEGQIVAEQVSIVLGKQFVLTFQEIEGDVFERVRQRIHTGMGKIWQKEADYLFYLLLDAIVDHYFNAVECLRDKIEDLEDLIEHDSSEDISYEITALKKQMRSLRKYIVPLKTELLRLRTENQRWIKTHTLTYIQDIVDNLNHLSATFDTFRDMLNDLMDLHLSYLSHSMNRVMKTLTVVSTIFIPLTFIVGVYGMNFDYMPELRWQWSYPIVWAIMIMMSLGMLGLMRWKKWF
jgi:magnesium transporter